MAASPRQWVMIVAAIAAISLMIHMGMYANGHNAHGIRHWFGGNETVPHWASQLSSTVSRVSLDIATLDEKLGALQADVRSADHRSSTFNKLINSTLKRTSNHQDELTKQVTEMKLRLESLSQLDSMAKKDDAIESDVKGLINTLNTVSSTLAAHIQEANSRHAAVTDNMNKLISSLADLQTALFSLPGAPKLHHWKPGDKETHKDKVAVIIESRPIHRLIRVVKQFMSGMKDDWEFQIWFSNLNEKMLRDSPDIQAMMRAGRLKMYPMGRDVFDIPWYNRLMMSNVTFWEFIGGKHVLIFQVDATLCSKSPKKIEEFLDYNYCGAPWQSPWYGDAGGNGGLSLRGREATLKCVRGFHGYGANEDGYFTECIAHQEERGEGKICRREVAKTFSVETVYYETPWGVHNAYTYLKPEETAALMQYCPELADARKPLQLEPN